MNPLDRKDEYSPRELMKGAGINVGIYNQWLYRNIFTATDPARGPGVKSKYSFSDILTVALIVRLQRADIRLKRASRIAHDIVAELAKWFEKKQVTEWPKAYVAFSGNGVKIHIAETANWEMVIMLDLDTIMSNIAGRVEEMKPE